MRSLAMASPSDGTKPPNVVLVITDDQGYGDLGCHGNPILRTPNLDTLHGQSVRLTDFHVGPTCAPTRASLMTGRYCNRTGVWHTVLGRSLLRRDEVTMADVFAAGGYRTGIFGKWHLGDNYPFRPQDRGFQEVLVHGGGGVGQTPDYWGNDYFDDTYWHNGTPKKYSGYCTDIWFDGAMRFIEANRDRPFFVYLTTNAPHGPFNVSEQYSNRYAGKEVPNANFYGMIANIDENMGRLLDRLKALGLEENTILIFMTDNGTAAGFQGGRGFNAGMRGTKGSEYDGGHRVPCFIRWPAGGLGGGRNVNRLTAHIDLLPTLIEMCALAKPKGVRFDGTSILPLLRGCVRSQQSPGGSLKAEGLGDGWTLTADRSLFAGQTIPKLRLRLPPVFTHALGGTMPIRAEVSHRLGATAKLVWRCSFGVSDHSMDAWSNSFDRGAHADAMQAGHVAGRELDGPDRILVTDSQRIEHPQKWRQSAVMTNRWRLINGKGLYDIHADPGQKNDVSSEHAEVVQELREAYEQWWADVSQRFDEYGEIVLGSEKENPSGLTCHDWHGSDLPPWNQTHILKGEEKNGFWAVEVEQAGEYEISLRRWPREADQPINAAVPGGRAIRATKARLAIGGIDAEKPVPEEAKEVTFRVGLQRGKMKLQTWLIADDGTSRGAYYVYVKRLS